MAVPHPSRSALLIVDVQRDFCPGGALPAPGGDRIVPALNRHIARAVQNGMPVYASRDWHPAVTTHFKEFGGEWPAHCVQGTPGAEFHPDLRLPRGAVVISKGELAERPGYSAFDGRISEGRTLADDLRDRRIETLYVGGLATDYCVKRTALDALREGFRVRLLLDAIAGIEAVPGDTARALGEMSAAGVEIADDIPSDAGRRTLRRILSIAAAIGTIIAALSIVRSSNRFRRGKLPPGVHRDRRLIGATRFPRKGDAA